MHFVEPFLVYFCWRLILPAEHQTILLNFRSLFGDNGEAWYGVDDDDDAACLLYDHKRMCHECDAQIHRLDVDELNVLWSDNWMVGIFLMYFASYTPASQHFIRSLVLFCNFFLPAQSIARECAICIPAKAIRTKQGGKGILNGWMKNEPPARNARILLFRRKMFPFDWHSVFSIDARQIPFQQTDIRWQQRNLRDMSCNYSHSFVCSNLFGVVWGRWTRSVLLCSGKYNRRRCGQRCLWSIKMCVVCVRCIRLTGMDDGIFGMCWRLGGRCDWRCAKRCHRHHIRVILLSCINNKWTHSET